MTPHMLPEAVGATAFETAPFYKNQGFNWSFAFSEPLTADDVEGINAVGHWTNENYVVRLYALPEWHQA